MESKGVKMKNVTACKLYGQISWNQLFDSEQELITKMLECETEKGFVPKGYEYIGSFKRYYKKNGCLTPKQLTQLKRLAKSVYAFVNNLKIPDLIVRI